MSSNYNLLILRRLNSGVRKRRISGWIGKGDDIRLSISAVNKFLREKGYQIIDNLHK